MPPPGPESLRRAPRVTLHAPTVLKWRSERESGSGTVSNMSSVGCYVLTQDTAALGEHLFLNFGDGVPEIECVVRYLDAEVGMGLSFLAISPAVQRKLVDFMKARQAFAQSG